MANTSLALASLRAAATVDQRSVCVWVFVLTLALSWVVRAETFSWDASSSRRSFRICGRQEERRQKTINKDGDQRIRESSSSNKHGSAEMFWWAEEDWEGWGVLGGLVAPHWARLPCECSLCYANSCAPTRLHPEIERATSRGWSSPPTGTSPRSGRKHKKKKKKRLHTFLSITEESRLPV